jgi:peptidoglycan/LPS O-acetylase OafA/YrhL
VCRWRASVHHVRARTPRFVCGGDDYLFILFDGISQVRAIPPPAPATAAATAAIAAAAVGMSVLCCSLVPTAHGPHRSWTAAPCAQLLATGVACDKWRIQKWPFATVSTSAACTLLFVECVMDIHVWSMRCTMGDI